VTVGVGALVPVVLGDSPMLATERSAVS